MAMEIGVVFYASGTKGKTVRADGKGGLLARGWYVRTADGLNGPHGAKRTAQIVADLAALEKDGFDWNRETREIVEIRQNPTVLNGREHDAIAIVSAEDGKDFADYYGEFRGGYPWIHPLLENFAENRGLVWQWIDGGTIGLYL